MQRPVEPAARSAPTDAPPVWAQSPERVLEAQHSDAIRGLSAEEARLRLERNGANRLRAHAVRSDLSILLDQFKSLVVGLLAVAAAVAFAFGQSIEGLAVTVVIALNAAIGFFTERQARRSMDALYALGARRARVLRDGALRVIPAEALVSGDIVPIEAGDIVTADLRVLDASRLQADESTLTGESLPVRKSAAPVSADAPLAERACLLFKGCAVTDGSGTGVVVATGFATELGRISDLMASVSERATPLEERLDRLARRLVWVTVGIALAVVLGGSLAGRDVLLMVETGLALAVAAIPEGLPVVATLALARGMRRMASRHVLVRRLASVETLGSIGVLCTDKTGTLTENRMSLERLERPDGTAASRAHRIAALCNTAELDSGDDGTGDPMERALLRAARRDGIERDALLEALPSRRLWAFDPIERRMASLHGADGALLLVVKGAPEVVLAMCERVAQVGGDVPLDTATREHWLARNEALAGEGMRVIALADASPERLETDPWRGLSFVALAALQDPPRSDVAASIRACRDAGIEVIMLTGDQPATALAIARAVGLVEPEATDVARGTALDDLAQADEATRQRLRRTRVFARVEPADKLALVGLHRRAGHLVAMTGDGVNDAPALRDADIGVAMGIRGTDVAKEAADMVLLDDAFASIVAAVEQGRIIYRNIRTFVLYLMSCNVAEVMIVAIAAIGGGTLPLLPLQILFLNLVTDVFPALALALGPGAPALMKRPPEDPGQPTLRRADWASIVAYAAVFTVAVLGALAVAERLLGFEPIDALTVSFLTLAFAQLWHVFSMRDPASPVFGGEVVRNRAVWAALALCTALLLVAVYVPPIAGVLGLAPPSLQGWLLIGVASLLPLLAGQLVLWIRARRLPPPTRHSPATH